MGFAKFFGAGRIYLLHYLLIILTFLAPLVFILYCHMRQKFRELSNIPLAALKFGLVFFYCFIDVPYLYLFYTSSFVSLISVSFFVSRNFSKPETETV